VVDVGNWERAIGINTPGQSGNPDSPFYRNLFSTWAEDGFFTVPYQYENVQKEMAEKMIFHPSKN
jgi:penicillin amidase